ncbi:MAG: glycosyltransferase family 2 protein [Candidatus Krumholzibacteria bacterium]|nr:glycosyltransferase family 2 protein [Candidatus Krumholzibacteria bacterium]
MTSTPRPLPPPRVVVIVLTWNGRDLTLECLESLRSVRAAGVEVVVVDNASSDGTAAAVRERHGDGVTLIENGANLGFSAGNNVGIAYALRRGARFMLLLNNDTAVDPDFIDELLRPLERDPRVGITGPKIYYYTPRDRIWFAGGEVRMARGLARHVGIRETDRGQYDAPREVDYVTGCALMARREVYEEIGLLDPSYAAYFEDTDLCMRARRAGYGLLYVPTAKVWHKISASTGGQLGRRKIARRLRSGARFFWRYARPYHWLTIPLFFVADGLRVAAMVATGRIRDATNE